MSKCIECKNKNEYGDICIKQRYQFFFADGSVACEDFELLESAKADRSEPEQKLPICKTCGKPRKIIGVLYEVHFDCKPEEDD